MPIPREMTVSCSKCGKSFSVNVFERVDTDDVEILPIRIVSGARFDVECPHCKNVSHLEEKCERERMAHIQKETYLAMQKRAALAEIASKRKKIRAVIILILFTVLLTVFSLEASEKRDFNSQLRNFATEPMSNDYTNVYADVISMEPEYVVTTESKSSYHGITEIICKCKTVEGKTIWATIDTEKYPGGNAYVEDKNEPQYYSKSKPMRLTGDVIPADRVVDGLEEFIGDIFVLHVRNLQDN